MAGRRSYHDLFITTADVPRARLFDLPFSFHVTCNRVAGWQLWRVSDPRDLASGWDLLAGEYDGPGKWLVLDVNGTMIMDSRPASRDLMTWWAAKEGELP